MVQILDIVYGKGNVYNKYYDFYYILSSSKFWNVHANIIMWKNNPYVEFLYEIQV